MLGLVQQLFRALKPSQRHTFVLLQALIVIRTVAEIAGVDSLRSNSTVSIPCFWPLSSRAFARICMPNV